MARTALPGRLSWQLAKVVEIGEETARTKTIRLAPPAWRGHRAGQHVDVRLTAPDGYQAQRSYSIASGPEDDQLELTIEQLKEGEVSPYLTNELRVGDELELRGPIGGYFVWEAAVGGPLMLVAGGSGIVPLRAMLRHWSAIGSDVPARVLYSARSLDEVIYRDELVQLTGEIEVRIALTRSWPDDWSGQRGRIDQQLLEQVGWPAQERPIVYICGSNGFVESIAQALLAGGHEATRIRTERFGPTGR